MVKMLNPIHLEKLNAYLFPLYGTVYNLASAISPCLSLYRYIMLFVYLNPSTRAGVFEDSSINLAG